MYRSLWEQGLGLGRSPLANHGADEQARVLHVGMTWAMNTADLASRCAVRLDELAGRWSCGRADASVHGAWCWYLLCHVDSLYKG